MKELEKEARSQVSTRYHKHFKLDSAQQETEAKWIEAIVSINC